MSGSHWGPRHAVWVCQLHQFEGDPLGAFEESDPTADVVHLLAEHVHAVGHQMPGGGANIIHTECKVIVATPPQICRMLSRILWRSGIELEQLNLEVRLGSFEHKRDVLSLHVRHAHVSCRRTTIDHRDVLLPEAQNLEELDRGRGIRDRNGYMIGIAEYPHYPPILIDLTGQRQRRPPNGEVACSWCRGGAFTYVIMQ